MKTHPLKAAGLLLLVFSLSACSLGAATPAAVPTEAGAAPLVPLPTVKPSEPCANEYFPVKQGATYAYSSTGSPSGPYTFSRAVTNVRADGFTLTTQVKGIEIVQEWACKPEGLTAAQMSGTDATSILAFEKFAELTSSNVSGVILPPVIAPGAEWAYALDIQGVERKEISPATMTGRVAVTFLAGNKESVTVPAGTFEALAIEVNTVIDFNVASASNVVQLTLDSTYTLWYAPGVGWIKSNGYGKLGGQEYFETIVLTSYSIP